MDTPLKVCKDCKQTFPGTTEYFQAEPRTKCGLKPRCRSCHLKQHAKEMQEWREKNPQRSAAYQREYRQKNPDFVRSLDRQRYQRDKIKRIAWQYTYRRLYPDRVKAARKSKDTPQGYRRILVACARRNARKRNLAAMYTVDDWQQCLKYFDYRCAICGRPRGFWHTLAQDHWIPLTDANCPGTIPTNIVPLCHGFGGCNNSKNDRQPEDWLIGRFGRKQAAKILGRIESYFHSITSNAANG